jgi:hypothetical protein
LRFVGNLRDLDIRADYIGFNELNIKREDVKNVRIVDDKASLGVRLIITDSDEKIIEIVVPFIWILIHVPLINNYLAKLKLTRELRKNGWNPSASAFGWCPT